MAIFYGICAIVLVLTLIGRWRGLNRPDKPYQLLDKAARDLDLAIDPANASAVAARLVRREKAALVGHVGAILIALPPYAIYTSHAINNTAHHGKPPTFILLIIMVPYASVALGRQVALAWLLVHEARRRSAQPGPRVARAVVPRLSDYVRPLEIWAARSIALVLIPLAVVAVATTKEPRLLAPTLAVGSLAVAALWAVAELAARRLLKLGQPAGNPVELAWDDALRSRQLRELFLFVSAFGLILTMFAIMGQVPDSLSGVPYIGMLAVLALLGLAGKPASHFRRRLWPWPTDGQAA